MEQLPDSVRGVAHSFNDAADNFEHSAASLWDRFGRRLVVRSRIGPGMRVLDAACGTGASGIPAARRVEREGRVTAIDIAPRLLAIGRAKARAHRLRNLQFQLGDLRTPPVAAASQDAVLCGFGLALVPDMEEGLRALWNVLRPGGILAFSTWGPSRFEPAHDLLMAAISREIPETFQDPPPWERLTSSREIQLAVVASGLPEPEIISETGTHVLVDGGSWWRLVLGSEYRWFIDRLEPSTHERIAAAVSRRLVDHGIGAVRADVHYVAIRKA